MDTSNSKYKEYLQSESWRAKRLSALKRDKYTCQCCGTSDRALDIHHLTYDRIYREASYDLVSLCRECHTAHHKSGVIEEQATEDFTYEINRNSIGFTSYKDTNINYAIYGDENFCMYQIEKIAEKLSLENDRLFIVNHKGVVCVWNDTIRADFGYVLGSNYEDELHINSVSRAMIKDNRIKMEA